MKGTKHFNLGHSMLFLLYNQATGNLTKSCPSTSSREVGPRDTSAWGLGRTAGWQPRPELWPDSLLFLCNVERFQVLSHTVSHRFSSQPISPGFAVSRPASTYQHLNLPAKSVILSRPWFSHLQNGLRWRADFLRHSAGLPG